MGCTVAEAGFKGHDDYQEVASTTEGAMQSNSDPRIFVLILLAIVGMPDIGANHRKVISEYIEQIGNSSDVEEVTEMIHHCSIATAYNSRKAKLLIHFADHKLQKAVAGALKQMPNCEHSRKAAPPSAQEDELSKWLQ